MTSNIRLIRFRDQCLWQVKSDMGWRVEPAKFVRYLLRQQGLKADEIDNLMDDASPVSAHAQVFLTRLEHRGKTIGYRSGTWVGPRCARESQLKAWLRRNGFSSGEITSLLIVADRQPVSDADLEITKSAVAYGIVA